MRHGRERARKASVQRSGNLSHKVAALACSRTLKLLAGLVRYWICWRSRPVQVLLVEPRRQPRGPTGQSPNAGPQCFVSCAAMTCLARGATKVTAITEVLIEVFCSCLSEQYTCKLSAP